MVLWTVKLRVEACEVEGGVAGRLNLGGQNPAECRPGLARDSSDDVPKQHELAQNEGVKARDNRA